MPQQHHTQPGDRFNRYFKIAPALCDQLRNEVFHIRHEVYAREFGFEPLRADEKETDAYDRHSLHCIVKTADDADHLVGCARIVMPDPDAPHAPLPFEIACRDTLDRSIIDPAKLPRHRIAEVSRLAVMADFRRRKGEKLSADASLNEQDFGGVGVHRFPNIPLSLYSAAVLMAQRQDIEYLFVLTEPRLSKHFAKFGVNITPIGEPIDFHGIRVPSVMRVAEIYPGLRTLFRPIWHAIEKQLDVAYAAGLPVVSSQADFETNSELLALH
ncbi:hypothetical protein RD110_00905 [Rhodoferax koreense]|uniref:GNAT family N-acetyltransferase n=1 Tax=Rhodoferax koreensis TaxID=1842727 RepID=A0A1P8JQD7_9BURK|nr:PEP-CTERM/exosortase system-associated acyltransferase [Rhodoferax koreense]APW35945.1 hypothetical protein RD110_00905 [Rhodoferax koreense]